MRPLKLEIEGFTAFRNPVCLDMTDLDLFAITGPTGAGKSSLIDAISYALYGRVPRVTNEVTSCISLGIKRMQVQLEFRAGDQCYRVHRETRRQGQGAVRLERRRGDGWQPLVDRAKDVNAQVAEIVGLDYDGFMRSVILPQGQFQEFLAGSSEKRRAVLRSLLRLEVYDRMRSRASGMAAELKTRIDERERALQELAEATPENASRLERELELARQEIRSLTVQISALDAALVPATQLNQAREMLRRCESDALEALEDFEKTRRLVDDGDEALSKLLQELEATEARLAENVYDPERHAMLRVALERARSLAQTQASFDQLQKAMMEASRQAEGATAAVEEARKAQAAAEQVRAAAETERDEAQRHNVVASIQHGLAPGDACPVCGGVIGELAVVDATGLELAEKCLAAARRSEAEARSSLITATNAATRAAACMEGYEQQLKEAERRLHTERLAVAEAFDEGDVTVTAISAALEEQVQAHSERRRLEAELKQRSTEVQKMRAGLDSARRQFAVLEQRSLAAAEALEAAQCAVAEAGRDVAKAADSWPDVAAALEKEMDVAVLLRGCLDGAQARRSGLQTTAGQLEARLERLKQDCERAEQQRNEIHGLKKEYNVSADLAQMLGAAKFQTFLQYEALQTLARDGSRRLEQLSNGRFKLQTDDRGGEFEVVDQWNADQARSVKTLSGGETFLASLSLSLALAESLPGLAAGRRVLLDSIFLDEGFGALDPEALDRAADALDALRTENRMVCVVTHLQDLAQRLPARVEVVKSESGSTIAVH